METIKISASSEYSVHIGNGLLKEMGEYLSAFAGMRSICIVSDDNVYPLYGSRVEQDLQNAGFRVFKFVFEHGEKSKNLETYSKLQEFLCNMKLTRSDAIVALGGGVVGDLAGFAAATYQRGIRYIQIPTTLLAAVDSSVGGKTAVDLSSGKNQVGAFYQPSLVLCDYSVFDTLPDEEYKCGCAEVIKYAVLGSRDFFDELNRTPVKEQYEHVISTCVKMKRDYVQEDEFDTGSRMFLNLGHTVGHAVEARSGFSILHGQAVAIGMASVARIACSKGFCSEKTRSEIIGILGKYGLATTLPYPVAELAGSILTDKKVFGNTLRLIVPEEIGKCRIERVDVSKIPEWIG
ncbi:MAG: 3-dehydroquinate synthase [Lachnospiraceae bacterium]|nr:3-dehydroquinate synthase [Lachnospiraceae bacterium]